MTLRKSKTMSKLETLIQQLCPDGVPYKSLGSLGHFYGGLTGKSKEDFKDGNAKFITYKNVYGNPALNIDVSDKVKIGPDEKQRTLLYGDIIFTGSSETPDECGMSSVVIKRMHEPMYLNSFCFVFRFDDVNIMLPDFSKHLFRSSALRYQIGKTASGVTRYNVSKKMMANVKIHIPPLEIQREIVRILDNFTELTTELTAELTARKKQYEYYKNKLLGNLDVEGVPLKMVCNNIFSGKNKMRLIDGKCPVYGSTGIISTTNIPVYNKEQILIARVGANAGFVHIANGEYDVSDNTLIVDLKEGISLKYVYYQLSSMNLHQYAKGGGQPLITAGQIKELKIVVPSLEKQLKIVSILDRFDVLCNDLTSGLPAEIEARQKQYEYYRDKLLTFKPLA